MKIKNFRIHFTAQKVASFGLGILFSGRSFYSIALDEINICSVNILIFNISLGIRLSKHYNIFRDKK